MSTALAQKPINTALPIEQLELIRRTVAAGATDTELQLFLYDCQRRGIHPLDKLLHFTKRGGKYTPVTSIDFMRAQAAMSGEMAGSDDAVFVNEESHPSSAMVTVYRITQGQRFAYSATARWSEYCPDNAPMWKRMPHTMLGKCAEALALRKAFPQQLAGLYSREEMDQADKPESGYSVTAPPVVESVNTTTGEVTDATELPPGAHRILNVKIPGPAASKAEITFDAPIAECDRSVLLTYKEQVATLAEQLCQDGTPCVPALKKSAAGNWRIEDLQGLQGISRGSVAQTPVLKLSDIPF